ncbi:hypothetical protein ACFOSC_02085 [Streptantibioticus rubrisoli]|uniref:Uncharacterized protein n=1 Tax=Streptantibioticus rubrisoli TaxID=1387313 RepID=A0ABT1PEZ7_9ACTN|nr:hypothetical protein [Streptantibioticus rubrisoli]MCQ4043366.1 hypothetical protein [Streptantibioticus rubrisoli]
MSDLSAREWGRMQAAKAPAWSEERWQRISKILGLELTETKVRGEPPDTEPPEIKKAA